MASRPPPARPSTPIAQLIPARDDLFSNSSDRLFPTSSEDEPIDQPEVTRPVISQFQPRPTRQPPILPLLLFDDGDTLVYIDPPLDRISHLFVRSLTTPHRLHSKKLLSTGSTHLTKFFQPRIQKRVAKQRGFEKSLPEGIKYLLDLTPPILEEDAIILLTEVSCPPGIRSWASQQSVWDLPLSCVGGIDICEPVVYNFCKTTAENSLDENNDEAAPKSNRETHHSPTTTDIQGEEITEAPDAEQSNIGSLSLPVDYSPVRHREGIENILNVLEGLSITLDTPSKLWTFFAISKVFDVATVPTVSGYILSWFYESNNIKFIEVHPEITYKVACAIKAHELCRLAFLVLVGDEALLHTLRSAQIIPRSNLIESYAHSRFNGFLEDNEVQRIEYASKSFAEDIFGHFLYLTGAEMSWLESCPEYQKLLQHKERCPMDQSAVDELVKLLKEFVRYRIYFTLRQSRDPVRSCDANPHGTFSKFHAAFNKRNVLQRLFGRSFWYDLLSMDLNKNSEFYQILNPHPAISDIGKGLLAFKGHENSVICYSPREDLEIATMITNLRIEKNSKTSIGSPKDQPNGKLNLTLNLRSPPACDSAVAPVSTLASAPTAQSNSHDIPFVLRPKQSFQDRKEAASDSDQAEAWDQSPCEAGNFVFESPSLDKGSASVEDYSNCWDFRHPSIDSSTSHHYPPDQDADLFDLLAFFVWTNAYIHQVARSLLSPPGRPSIQLTFTDTLDCLSENQWKFLPLWAGGNDDGSGGAFADQNIPSMEIGGFSAPGPSVHTGSAAASDDSFSDIGPWDSRSTLQGASHHATQSHRSQVQSIDSFGEGFMVEPINIDSAKPTECVDGSQTEIYSTAVDKYVDSINFEIDGADSDSNSTLMAHQSDSSDDVDMCQSYDVNDDHENKENDNLMSDAVHEEFDIVDDCF